MGGFSAGTPGTVGTKGPGAQANLCQRGHLGWGGGRGPSASICRDRGREEMVKIGEREEIKLKALKQRREQANDPHKEAEKHV